MRLVDLDKLNQENFNGKTAIMRFLDKYERENPLEEIAIGERDGWEIVLTKTAQTVTSGTQA